MNHDVATTLSEPPQAEPSQESQAALDELLDELRRIENEIKNSHP